MTCVCQHESFWKLSFSGLRRGSHWLAQTKIKHHLEVNRPWWSSTLFPQRSGNASHHVQQMFSRHSTSIKHQAHYHKLHLQDTKTLLGDLRRTGQRPFRHPTRGAKLDSSEEDCCSSVEKRWKHFLRCPFMSWTNSLCLLWRHPRNSNLICSNGTDPPETTCVHSQLLCWRNPNWSWWGPGPALEPGPGEWSLVSPKQPQVPVVSWSRRGRLAVLLLAGSIELQGHTVKPHWQLVWGWDSIKIGLFLEPWTFSPEQEDKRIASTHFQVGTKGPGCGLCEYMKL